MASGAIGMSMSSLDRRVTRLDHRVPPHVRDLSRLSDAQLEALIEAELAKYDPALAARYAAADDNGREAILKAVAGAER
jgi:hypothetical protein